jgi:hypothetical protein
MSLLLPEQFDLAQEWVPAFAGKTRKEPLLKNEWVRLKFGPLLFIDRMVSNDAASYALVKAEAAAGGGQRPAFTRA